MIIKISNYIMVFSLLSVLAACDGNQSNETTETSNNQDIVKTKTQLTLTEISSPEFPEAALEMNEPLEGANYETGKIVFKYNIKNYNLSVQTLDADAKQCANSGKGQHIHFIVNGEPYKALYTPDYEAEFKDGSYVVLSFLSRSYHESLKHYGAYVLTQFTVGDDKESTVDLTAPHMFYSRPKGEYKGSDTKKVILDFYLVNTDLSPEGNKVRATINDEQFLIDKWAPYFMEGLPFGENSIKLELVDNLGNVIKGPFNTVERKITLVDDNAT